MYFAKVELLTVSIVDIAKICLPCQILPQNGISSKNWRFLAILLQNNAYSTAFRSCIHLRKKRNAEYISYWVAFAKYSILLTV